MTRRKFSLRIGEKVEKFTGEAQWWGTVVSVYFTTKMKERVVVEVWPQGFQMIAVPDQLRLLRRQVEPASPNAPDAGGAV